MSKADKKKGPRSLFNPSAKKTIKSEYEEDWREMHPAWRVSLLVIQTPFGWSKLDPATAEQVRERLSSYESMKWKEIVPSYRSHFIKATDLCKDARDHLAQIEQDDTDSIVSLGIDQTTRVFGILEHNILKVLWFDPDHEVCPTQKPNT